LILELFFKHIVVLVIFYFGHSDVLRSENFNKLKTKKEERYSEEL